MAYISQVSSSASAPPRRSLFWVALAFFFAFSALWALASPIYSVPDENAHVAKTVAQLRGQVVGYEVPGVKHTVVDLPPGYLYSPGSVCFVYQPDVAASCAPAPGTEGSDWFNTWVGAYNPTYYYLVGWPSLGIDGAAGIYAMRLMSALVGSLFLAFAAQAALASMRARWVPLGIAFLASPMVVYFAGSVNPQGLEVAAAAALWVSLLRLLQTHGEHSPVTINRSYLWVIVALSAAVVANVRALGPLWIVVIIGSCLIISGWDSTKRLFTTGRSYLYIAFVAVAGLFSLGWTLIGGSLSHQAGESDAPLVGASFLRGFAYMLRMTPANLEQASGFFGWLDTPLPSQAYGLFYIAIALLVIPALIATGRRGGAKVGFVVLLAIFVPALVQGYSIGQTGAIWQGRYGLFLYIAIALVAAMVLSSAAGSRLHFLSVRMTIVVVGLLSAFGIGAFALVLRRYVVGNATPITQMISNPQWQPPLGWPVLVALMVVTWLAFAAWLVWRAVIASRIDPVLDLTTPATPPLAAEPLAADAPARPATAER